MVGLACVNGPAELVLDPGSPFSWGFISECSTAFAARANAIFLKRWHAEFFYVKFLLSRDRFIKMVFDRSFTCMRLTMRDLNSTIRLAIFGVVVLQLQANAEDLRYNLEPMKSIAYRVTIVAETPAAIETMSGMFALTGKQADGRELSFDYQGGLSKTTKSKINDLGIPFGLGRPFSAFPRGPFDQPDFRGLVQADSEIVMADTGEVKIMRGNTQLPYLPGNLSLFPFDYLPQKDMQEWKQETVPTVTSKNSDDDWRFGRFGPWGSSKQERIKRGGSEITSYEIQSRQGSLVTIAKTYLLTSPSTGDEDIGYRVEGNGTWIFDADLGLSESMDFKSQITISEGNTDVRIPVTLNWKRISREEYDTLVQEQKEKAAAMRKVAEERMAKAAAEKKEGEGKQLDAKEKEAILADLNSAHWPDVSSRLHKMNGFVPHPSDFDIALKIKELRLHRVVGVSLPAKQMWDGLEKVMEAKGGVTTSPADAADNPFATAEEKSLAAGSQMRQWSDSTGSFKVEAKFQRMEGESVILLRKDGNLLEVPYTQLGAEDQKLVDSLKEKIISSEKH